MTWALGRRGCGAVCALAVIALWGRECRCQIVADCCTQCKSGTIYIQGVQVSVDPSTCESPQVSYCRDSCISGKYRRPDSCGWCYPCITGSYCVNSMMTPCAENQYSSAGASQCTPYPDTCCAQCSKGTISINSKQVSIDTSSCAASGYCNPAACGTGGLGSYILPNSCGSCFGCLAGSYCVNSIQYKCAGGTHTPGRNYQACLSCIPGQTYQNSAGATTCKTCATGCPVGQRVAAFCNLLENIWCETCTSPWTTTSTTQTTCSDCVAGKYKRLSSSTCITCDCSSQADTYISCPAGSLKPTCTACTGTQPGQFCPKGQEPSLVCDGTQFQDTFCVACPVGKHKPEASANQRSCDKCPTGTYKDSASENDCVSCTNKNGLTYAAAAYYTAWNFLEASSNMCPWYVTWYAHE